MRRPRTAGQRVVWAALFTLGLVLVTTSPARADDASAACPAYDKCVQQHLEETERMIRSKCGSGPVEEIHACRDGISLARQDDVATACKAYACRPRAGGAPQ